MAEDMEIDHIIDVPDTPDRSNAGNNDRKCVGNPEKRGRAFHVPNEISKRNNYVILSPDKPSPSQNASIFRRSQTEKVSGLGTSRSSKAEMMEKGKTVSSKIPSKSSHHGHISVFDLTGENGQFQQPKPAFSHRGSRDNTNEDKKELKASIGNSSLPLITNSSNTSRNAVTGKCKLDNTTLPGSNTFMDRGKSVSLSNDSQSQPKAEKQVSLSPHLSTAPRGRGNRRLVRNGCISPQNIATRAKQSSEQSIFQTNNVEQICAGHSVSSNTMSPISIDDIVAEERPGGRLKGKGVLIHPSSHGTIHIDSSPVVNHEEASGSSNIPRNGYENWERQGGWRTTHNDQHLHDVNGHHSRRSYVERFTHRQNMNRLDRSDTGSSQNGKDVPASLIIPQVGQSTGPSTTADSATKRPRKRESSSRNPNVASHNSKTVFVNSSGESSSSSRSCDVDPELAALLSIPSFNNELNEGLHDNDNNISVARAMQLEADERLARELQEQLYNDDYFEGSWIDEHLAREPHDAGDLPTLSSSSSLSLSLSLCYRSILDLDMAGNSPDSHHFNHDSLLNYCSSNVSGFPLSPTHFNLSQFGHGQSNPTYLMEVGSNGSIVKKYVLRKKPAGKLLASAHAVEREFQVLQALGNNTNVPVPKVFCLCNDPTVIGTPFYIMEYLEGRIFIDPKLPGLAPESRSAIYRETAKTLASLHSANVDSIGLGNYGRRNDYCKRQIERWAKQYVSSTSEGKPASNPKMFALIDWLRHHIPSEDSSGATAGLVHGDFRIDNLVFHPTEDRVIGILDWELSTLGNQMCDVAYICMCYVKDIGEKSVQEGMERSGLPQGIPSLPEFLAEYCSLAGRRWPVAEWKFYVAFSFFRGASIYAGVYNRWVKGNASGGERARYTEVLANGLIEAAWEFIERKVVLPQHPPSGVNAKELVQDLPNEGRFAPSQKVLVLRNKIIKFMEEHIYPMEEEFYKLSQSEARWTVHPAEEKLKELAKKEGLWNLWIPVDSAARAKKILFDGSNNNLSTDSNDLLLGAGLTNLEYGYLCEFMGHSLWAPQIFNCGAPDTGNMEVLLRNGNKEQMLEWLIPLLEGKIRSGFAMTEPQIASSDATNIECSIKRQGDSYIINGTKWWTSGAMDPRCRILILMGKTDFNAARHKQQSMILVDTQTPGVHIKRPLTVFGFDDAPHGHAEVVFENVRVPATNILMGEGRGFEIAQARLGPGRLHHCMRLIGAAERGMQLMAHRALSRKAFGKMIAQHGSFVSDLAKCRIELEKTRLLVLEAADQLDRYGNKKARGIIAMAKVAAPKMGLMVLDMAIQVHGAAGVSSDTVLAHLWAAARTLRIADGPDEVHLGTIGKLELEIQRAKL